MEAVGCSVSDCDAAASTAATDVGTCSGSLTFAGADDGEEEDEDDDDPASWFHDDQDDGIKGQNIVYPDAEDLSDIIRVDGSRFSYNT